MLLQVAGWVERAFTHVLREAYGWFKDFGELPDDDRVAFEVVQQALRGGNEHPLEDEAKLAARVQRAGIAYQRREAIGDTWPPTVRALLFDEALFAHPALQKLARAQIAVEVTYGGDVESPGFGARHGIPIYGSIAMHIAGYPTRLALPPYKDQARRLFVRLDNIRGRIDHDDPGWFEAQAEAVSRFYALGKLPDDELHLEALLVMVELDLLQKHKKGKDVAKAMALFNQLARPQDEHWDEALDKLCEMAKAGRIH